VAPEAAAVGAAAGPLLLVLAGVSWEAETLAAEEAG
jgi:hypothetical protein